MVICAHLARDEIECLGLHRLVVAPALWAASARLAEARLQRLAPESISEFYVLDPILFVISTANSNAAVA